MRHQNAERLVYAGPTSHSTAELRGLPLTFSPLVLGKTRSWWLQPGARAGRNPPRIDLSGAVATGTSRAKSGLNDCAGASGPPHRRARRGASAGLLAAQLRRASVETSRALLLLPPSLVRSGALRSDIYSSAPAAGRRAGAVA